MRLRPDTKYRVHKNERRSAKIAAISLPNVREPDEIDVQVNAEQVFVILGVTLGVYLEFR